MRRCGLLLTMAVCFAFVAGCGDGSPPGGSGLPSTYRRPSTYRPPSVPATPPASSPSARYAQTDDADCPSNYPAGLLVSTDVQIELQYLRDVVACTNAAHSLTYLKNEGEVVWRPRVTPTWSNEVHHATYFADTASARSYRSAVAGLYAKALLTPGQVLVVDAAPQLVAWDLDLPLSLSYQVHDTIVSELQRYGEGAVVAALDTRSRRGAALAGCAISGYHVAKDAPDLADKPPQDWIMLGISGSAGVSTCASSWKQADTAEAAAGRKLTLTADELPTLRARQAELLEKADTYLTRATKAGKIIRVLFS